MFCIDEKSMVSNICLLHIHNRLCEIFNCPEIQPFADLCILIGSDLLQLAPTKSYCIFEKCNTTFVDFLNLLSLFLKAQLIELMRQKGDENFKDLLKKIKVDEAPEDNMKQL